MVVGVGQILLRLPENCTLKGKRRVIKQIIDKVKRQFNVSIAEVDAQNHWQFAHLGLCQVSTTKDYVNTNLEKILDFIENLSVAEILDVKLEIIHFSSKVPKAL
ncbi:MAG: hypothetical protein AMJ45_01900 [Syntrophobacter sp. DG_60]|nr:MAG: hypothetical protein AMJ45_01900 [Syntrophobacter sp. DG_60]